MRLQVTLLRKAVVFEEQGRAIPLLINGRHTARQQQIALLSSLCQSVLFQTPGCCDGGCQGKTASPKFMLLSLGWKRETVPLLMLLTCLRMKSGRGRKQQVAYGPPTHLGLKLFCRRTRSLIPPPPV